MKPACGTGRRTCGGNCPRRGFRSALCSCRRNFSRARRQALEILRVHARIPLLAGCSSAGLIAGAHEVENAGGLALALYSLPGAELKGVHFTQAQVEEANGAYWHLETGVEPEHTNGWLVFIDPFHLDAEGWMRGWNEAYAPVPAFGGLASGVFSDQTTQVYLNGDVFEDGGVAISVGGDVKLAGVISQGCTPIGETWTLTRVEKNLIHHIGNRPAYAVLAETFQKLPPDEQRKAAGQSAHRPGRQRIPRGFSPRRFSRAQSHRRRPAFRRAGRRRAAARGADDAIPAARRGGGDRGHERTARRAPRSSSAARRFTAAASAAATAADRIFSARRTTMPGWCRNSSARSASPVFSATARSAPSAGRIICTASRPRSRCL